MSDRAVAVVRAGALTTVQDLGRGGYAHLGVPRSGALDPAAVRLVNRLVGNPGTAAVLETTVDGCALRPRCAVTVAVGGAPCPVRVDGRPAAWGASVRVGAGSVLDIGAAVRGLRAYVAFGGGIDVEPVLGSRSTDLLSGLGPAPLVSEAVLPLGPVPAGPPPVDVPPWPGPPDALVLRVRFGPRDDWFTGAALRTFATRAYRVSPASNRIGLRLEGPALERAVPGELASEGMVLGAVQVPPDGRPLVFLADHPTTGGYPVIGVVRESDLGTVAQAVPGTPVRFTPVR
ncbi:MULTISPECIES: biotin-dependent carboxyltransferase family protein [unclassified Streptomyces]|uniref:5-oxoprolinase subunit C family protein n=1 Tax=unclassified Streptomyces TaxID=2593676 RepID=UPI0006FE54E5|nr:MULTISPECIES: biotin-dependent carboxyltransferase family protein [unclassified Streptomyces]KQX48087.1 allophanate hydrolase [Streptomyces sp. Root1304]KRA82479.1 allophanate hydrolase [Streptomyces sp. Root66D1]